MKFLVANWKMNGGVEFTENFSKTIGSIKTENKVIICPPFPLLCKFKNFSHSLGAQNCSDKQNPKQPTLARESAVFAPE